MQLHGLIIVVAAASVFEMETNTGPTAKCVCIMYLQWIISSLAEANWPSFL